MIGIDWNCRRKYVANTFHILVINSFRTDPPIDLRRIIAILFFFRRLSQRYTKRWKGELSIYTQQTITWAIWTQVYRIKCKINKWSEKRKSVQCSAETKTNYVNSIHSTKSINNRANNWGVLSCMCVSECFFFSSLWSIQIDAVQH